MNNGAFGENFPYSNFHDLNMDWIIKIAKDFLDQYTNIQNTIEQGLEDLDTKAENLQELLDAWYTEHSQDIANQLEDALSDLNQWYTEHQGYLNQYLADSITAFNEAADSKAEITISTIPDDYTALSKHVNRLENSDDFFGKQCLNLTFTGGYINPATLEINSATPASHLLSNVVLIPARKILYIPKISKSLNTVLLCKCQSDGTPEKMLLRGCGTNESTGDHIMYPIIEDTYIRFAGNSSMIDYMQYYMSDFDTDIEYNQDTYGKFNPISNIEYVNGKVITDNGLQTGSAYAYTSNIVLPKGMTIEYWSAGSLAMASLSKWTYNYEIIESLDHGDGRINHRTYTAPDHMFVRLSARISAPTDANSVVLPSNKFLSWKIYYKPLHYTDKDNNMYQKHLTVMGDSLVSGNQIGKESTWINNLKLKYDMIATNLGINGNTVAVQTIETEFAPMVNRISEVPINTELFILIGGANDKRLNVPLGEVTSNDTSTFCGALNSIIDNVRLRAPKTKILFMTTYMRYTSRNSLGLGDEDYANAMKSVCLNRLIPCFDNFHESGVDFTNETLRSWMDESRNRQQKVDEVIVYHSDTHHFSLSGYEWVTPLYEALCKAY